MSTSKTVFHFADGSVGPGRWDPADGGRVIPDAFVETITSTLQANPWAALFPTPVPVRLTWRRRLEMKVMDLRYALARRLYPYGWEVDE